MFQIGLDDFTNGFPLLGENIFSQKFSMHLEFCLHINKLHAEKKLTISFTLKVMQSSYYFATCIYIQPEEILC